MGTEGNGSSSSPLCLGSPGSLLPSPCPRSGVCSARPGPRRCGEKTVTRGPAHGLGIFLISSFDCCIVLFGGPFGERGHWGQADSTPTLTASVRLHPPRGVSLHWGSSCFGCFWPVTFSFYSGCIELCNRSAASSARTLLLTTS